MHKHMRPSDEELQKRRDQLLAEEKSQPCHWWYLSFADPQRPAGQQWLGGVFIFAPGFATAVDRTHRLGINPGGEVRGASIPEGHAPPVDKQQRLLNMQDLDEMGGAERMP